MRPYNAAADVVLYVKRDTMRPTAWRLAWWNGESDSFVYAEGECSARLFKRRYQAVAHGVRAYGETARNWPRGA